MLHFLVWAILAALKPKVLLVAENLCLRQQLLVLQRTRPQTRLRNADRQFWICASRWFADWRNSFHIVKPETVLRWHRRVTVLIGLGDQVGSAEGVVDSRFRMSFKRSSGGWPLKIGFGVKDAFKLNSQDWDLEFLPGPSPST